MIRKIFKKPKKLKNGSSKLKEFIKKYKIPREYLSTNRKSISRGVLVGLFWGFIPMPMQMLGVISTTPITRFNVPIAISMVWLSNPITMPFMYYMEYLTGNFILGYEGIKDIELTLDWFSKNWDCIVVPLYVGASFYSIIVSYLIYLLINRLWIYSIESEHRGKKLFDRLRSKRR